MSGEKWFVMERKKEGKGETERGKRGEERKGEEEDVCLYSCEGRAGRALKWVIGSRRERESGTGVICLGRAGSSLMIIWSIKCAAAKRAGKEMERISI